MAYEFKLPDLGEGLTEGEIARWLVTEGQEIEEDDPLVEIQTDKTTVEIPSPAAGVVVRILVGEGDVVPVGTTLVVIGSADGDGATLRHAAFRRPRWCAASPPNSASTSSPSPAPARTAASWRSTSGPPPRPLRPPQRRPLSLPLPLPRARAGGSGSAACGARSSST
jgi:pyruvate dehydrogenase E2 component (dihydrolipoamide acetyltransferase)